MTRQTAMAMLTPQDLGVMGEHTVKHGIRLETLDTQAGMRAYYRWKNAARRAEPPVRVTCGETNNGTGRFFVRITGLED